MELNDWNKCDIFDLLGDQVDDALNHSPDVFLSAVDDVIAYREEVAEEADFYAYRIFEILKNNLGSERVRSLMNNYMERQM